MEKFLDRLSFMFSKMWGAFRWMALSGVITYALVALSNYIGGLELAKELSGILVVVINTLLFAVAKFVEGEDK